MICADFLAGSATEENQSEVLVLSLERHYQTLPEERKMQLAERIKEGPWGLHQKQPRLVLDEAYDQLKKDVLSRDGWKCQDCGASANLQVHHLVYRSSSVRTNQAT
jgi:5-methylcytosine-specific restriction endonuclease McrA